MWFPLKLKAFDKPELADAMREVNRYSCTTQHVISIFRETPRQPLYVLEEIWKEIVYASQQEYEIVFKLARCSRRSTKHKTDVYLREFAETDAKAHRFTGIVTALRLVTQNLRRRTTTTIRDIFYRDVSAFQGSQYRLNESLRSIASSLRCSLERDLRVVPSPKGLLFGGPQICLELSDGANVALRYDGETMLVPTYMSKQIFHTHQSIEAIVVMEKEAVFKSFSGYLREINNLRGVVMLTGKGNPDKASVNFLRALRKSFASVPILVFVDSDVYGLRIWWTYMLAAGGPASNVIFSGTYLHEHLRGHLTIAPKEWKLMMNFLKEVSEFENSVAHEAECLLQMKRELTRGMLLGLKAELNIVCGSSQDESLNTYLWKKVQKVCDKT